MWGTSFIRVYFAGQHEITGQSKKQVTAYMFEKQALFVCLFPYKAYSSFSFYTALLKPCGGTPQIQKLRSEHRTIEGSLF